MCFTLFLLLQQYSKQLEETMERFAQGEIKILICTNIVESGLDIQNANTIIIQDVQQFGLAQLYQVLFFLISSYVVYVTRFVNNLSENISIVKIVWIFVNSIKYMFTGARSMQKFRWLTLDQCLLWLRLWRSQKFEVWSQSRSYSGNFGRSRSWYRLRHSNSNSDIYTLYI